MAEQIAVSINFIEQELPDAPPLYVSIYLLTLAWGRDAAKIAARLNATESDVLRAWLYWSERGVLPPAEQTEQPVTQPAQSVSPAPAEKPLPFSAERPDYTPQELACYLKNADLQNLIQLAAKKMGRLLSQNDISTIFSFHDWLGLPLDVIALLISYCTANGHTGIRYIEKVALGWAEEGITTEEKAIAYIELRRSGFRAIFKAFGLGNRLPVPAEETYMKAWLSEYALPQEIVLIACERTVLQTGKPSFPYADKILRQWRDAGVKTKADIEALDLAFAAQKKQAPQRTAAQQKPAEPPKPRQNRFINYTQSEWDFDELERLEREQRKKW